MKWIAVLLAVAACQAGKTEQASPSPQQTGSSTIISLPKAQLTDAYRADIANLCDSLRLSGAIDKPADERWTHLAMWLGPHITTDAGHEFLVAIQPLQGEAKAMALESEAKRAGQAKCDLANEWRK